VLIWAVFFSLPRDLCPFFCFWSVVYAVSKLCWLIFIFHPDPFSLLPGLSGVPRVNFGRILCLGPFKSLLFWHDFFLSLPVFLGHVVFACSPEWYFPLVLCSPYPPPFVLVNVNLLLVKWQFFFDVPPFVKGFPPPNWCPPPLLYNRTGYTF